MCSLIKRLPRATSNLTQSTLLTLTAINKAVSYPGPFVIELSLAPLSSKSFAVSGFLAKTAQCKGL